MDFYFYDPFTDLCRIQKELGRLQREMEYAAPRPAAQKKEQKKPSLEENKEEQKKEEEDNKAVVPKKEENEEEEDNDEESMLLYPFQDYKELWYPAVDLKETKDGYELHAELPGVKKEDVHIELHGQGANKRLVISGKKEQKKEDEGEKWHRVERCYGNFERAFTVPADTTPEEIKAKFEEGILVVSFPKPKKVEPVKIEIN